MARGFGRDKEESEYIKGAIVEMGLDCVRKDIIAKELDITASYVRMILRDAGINYRDPQRVKE